MINVERFVSAEGEFVPPTRDQQLSALSPPTSRRKQFCDDITTELSHSAVYASWDGFFVSKMSPGSLDWLQGPGKAIRGGQTFAEFVDSSAPTLSAESQTIGLVSIGELESIVITDSHSQATTRLVMGDILREVTECFFTLPVRWLSQIPASSIGSSRRSGQHKLIQLRTPEIQNEILHQKKKKANHDIFCVMGITMFDLYTTRTKTSGFKYGEVSIRQRSGIVSLVRHTLAFNQGAHKELLELQKKTRMPRKSDEEDEKDRGGLFDRPMSFFGKFGLGSKQNICRDIVIAMPTQEKNAFVSRCIKVLLREVGHLFGLKPCVFFECVMNGTNHLEELHAQPMHLCPLCLKKLHFALRCGKHEEIDFVVRAQNLRDFYSRLGLMDVAQWYEKRATRIRQGCN